ncbi:MAG: leucine-rich repeat domain-containing protein [Treponema sp.]|jgi:hypothetical protein|nr:leucine-rich repeat domain-containing protein [Treponema sp.]
MKRIFLIFTAALSLAALDVYAADSDFTVDANGVITTYTGFDTEVVIPAAIGGKKITAIGKEAFRKADLTSVTIPEGVTLIGEEAFAENKLTSITIPGTVKTLGDGAFWKNNLAAVVISEGVEEDLGAFRGNKADLTITIPSTLRVFNSNLWDKATAILPDKLNVDFNGRFSRGGDYAKDVIFYNYIANGRAAGTYTSNMTCIEKRADDHRYIETQYGPVLIGYNGNATRLRIPAEIGGLPVKTLYFDYGRYSGMVAVQIPEGVSYIGKQTFRGCKLESIAIPASVTYIGDEAFGYINNENTTNKLKTLAIPEGVAYIGKGAFSGNDLSSLTLPAKGALTTIDDSAFAQNKLTSVIIPASVVYIGNKAFNGNNLTSITIPASVVYIGDKAFPSMKNITIPPTVTTLGGCPIDYHKGDSIVIGANVAIPEREGFGAAYYRSGRKAGRYTAPVDSDMFNRYDSWTYAWTYSAK